MQYKLGDHKTIILWDVKSGVEKMRLYCGGGPSFAVVFSPSGEYLASCRA